jgi:hypothetical protein
MFRVALIGSVARANPFSQDLVMRLAAGIRQSGKPQLNTLQIIILKTCSIVSSGKDKLSLIKLCTHLAFCRGWRQLGPDHRQWLGMNQFWRSGRTRNVCLSEPEGLVKATCIGHIPLCWPSLLVPLASPQKYN